MFGAGHHAELESRARMLLERYPEAGFVWKVLGVMLQMQGRDSLLALRKAAELLPGDHETHYNLGNTLLLLNRLNEAEASYRQALHIRPDDADACFNLGNALWKQGRLDEAAASYLKALKIRPDHAEVYGNLGNILQELGKLDEAEASYRRALQLKPGYAAAHYNLGNLLHDRNRLGEAEASYRQALKISPDNVDAHTNLGNLLQELDRLEEAEASFRQALQIKPDYAEAHGNLGKLLLDRGRIDEAEASFWQALQVRPDDLVVRLSLALARKVKAGDENMAALIATEQATRNSATPLPVDGAMCLHFALGKCYDDTGVHEKAFPHFLEGNRLKCATSGFNPDQAAQYFASIMQNFDTEALGRLRGGGDSSPLPIFILGMPRSGTTLVEQIVSSYPGIHGAGELPDMKVIMRRNMAGSAFHDNLSSLDQAQLASWGAEYVAGLQSRAPSALRVTDKMPANFLVVGLIHLMLPNAKIIHVKRNPADTCLSCFTQLFKDGQEFSYDLAELGRYYAGYARLMAHWRNVLPEGAFLDVRYEDVVADQEAQSRRIIDYCGLEWNDACLDFHRNERAVKTASMAQVRRPIYQSSVERWRSYEKFLEPLFDALGDLAPER
ncbi:MAG: tetratricopeptide repeat protein [Gallionella sp.]|nr:tetratricopeptide repeat protein [Gallionella sp.]